MWDLVPRPGMEPGPPSLGGRSLSHWTTKEVSLYPFSHQLKQLTRHKSHAGFSGRPVGQSPQFTVRRGVCAPFCLIPSDPTDCSPPGSSLHGMLQAKNTGVGCRALLQEIFQTQGSNLCLLHYQGICYHWAASDYTGVQKQDW